MEELVKTFHINWTGIIGQLINFTIVVAVLYFFATKPLLKIMHERSEKIDKSLKQADEIEKNAKEAEAQKQAAIIEGQKTASGLVATAEKESEEIRKEKVDKTRKETEKIVADAKREITSEREKMLRELRSELGELVLLASNKLTQQTLNDATHKKMVTQVIEDLKTEKIS